MPQPLNEVFGFPVENFSSEAIRHRREKLCPFNNRVSGCTKSKKENPLGVCSIHSGENQIVVCPVRFRQDWRIISDTRDFLVPNATKLDWIREIKVKDLDGYSLGNADLILLDLDDQDQVQNFGVLEIQSVYITGNLRSPFAKYMEDPATQFRMNLQGLGYPKPDWLSSIKRLIHQVNVKGSAIVKGWDKRLAIAAQLQFFQSFNTFQTIPSVRKEDADCAWFLYDLKNDPQKQVNALELEQIIYFRFDSFIKAFQSIQPSLLKDFRSDLKRKLARQKRQNE